MERTTTKFISVTQILAACDEREARVRNALEDAAQLRSLIHDGLTGPNDLWLKTQLIDAVDAVEHSLKRAL